MTIRPDARPTPITPPYVPLIDPRTGQVDRAWYMFFLSLFNITQTVAAVENVGPDAPTQIAAVMAALAAAQQEAQTQPRDGLEQYQPMLDSIAQRLDTQPTNASVDQIAQLVTELQALALTPPATPHVPQRRYGSFYDTTTQTASLTNTAYGIKYNTTDLSMGVTIGSPTSRVYVDRAGIYDIQFSAQLDNTSGGDHLTWIWLRVNGTDVPYSASELRIKGNDAELVAAWNFLYNFKDGDYFELMWAVDDTGVQIKTVGAVAPVPAIPSVILTVTDNISNG